MRPSEASGSGGREWALAVQLRMAFSASQTNDRRHARKEI
jgi:hypothetical protein